MAETSEGWDGTVNEAGIARILASAGPGQVGSSADFRASAVSGLRRIILTPGASHYGFIRYTDNAARAIDLPLPTAGRWHLIVQRRDWANNTVQTLALAGPTTTGTFSPPPEAFPADFAKTPGVSADLPLYWAWVNATNTNVVLRDLRNYTYPFGKPFVHAGMTGAFQVLTGNVVRDILIAQAQVLRGGMVFNPSGANSHQVIVPDAGMYRLTAQFYWTGGANGAWFGGYLHVDDPVSALLFASGWKGNENDVTSFVSAVRYLEAGSVITIKAQTRGSGNMSTWGTDGYNGTFLEVEKL